MQKGWLSSWKTILKDDGKFKVKFIISKNLIDAKVADRAIPTAIFEAELEIW